MDATFSNTFAKTQPEPAKPSKSMAELMKEDDKKVKPPSQTNFTGSFLLPDPKQPLPDSSSLKITGTKLMLA